MRTKTVFAVAALAALGATAVYADKGMKDADADGDGFVSLDEFKSAHSARIEEHFMRMDTNADGLLSEEEMTAAKKDRRANHRKQRSDQRHDKRNPEETFKRLDVDNNGSLSFEELDGKHFSPDVAMFQAADADGSGELNATEMHAMMQARWEERHGADNNNDD
ncbi:MAG TPA: EF-hand domain-containing protein [Woeseiaceae bacterium]|nr:EF-hand domain-containing protein [Woeseiaceae bacterium]